MSVRASNASDEVTLAPRQAWVDCCKGIGISAVVFGHVSIGRAAHDMIYLFHMPLFFFLSGYLHTPKGDLFAYFKRKSVHLLIPYLSFLGVLYPFEILRAFAHHSSTHELAHKVFAGLWGGSELTGLYGVFWFLPCLFLTQQLVNLLLVKVPLKVVALVVSFSLLLGYANAYFLPGVAFPLDANVVLAAIPFFFVGFLASSCPPPARSLLFLAVGGSLVAGWLVWRAVPIAYDLRDSVYGVPALSFVLALSIIGAVVLISKACSKVRLAQSILGGIGGKSMAIMFVHKALPALPVLARLAFHHGIVAGFLFIAVSYTVGSWLQATAVTRAFFMGSESDLNWLLREGGIVGKRAARQIDLPYQSGRSSAPWLEVRPQQTYVVTEKLASIRE